MRKILFPLLLLGAGSYAQVVKDTIYVNEYQVATSKENASSYFVYNGQKNQLTNIENFDINDNQLILKGKGIVDSQKDITWNGLVELYNKQNQIILIYDFDSTGTIIKVESFDTQTGDKYTANYQDGQIKDGQVLQEADGVLSLMQIQDFQTKSLSYINKENKKNRADYIYNNDLVEQSLYFDNNGKQIYNCIYSEYSPFDGQEFSLFHQSLDVFSVSHYKQGELIESQTFFKNGKLQSKAVIEKDLITTTYWNNKGDIIGSIITKDDMYSDGTLVYFGNEEQSDYVSTIYNYKNGEITSYSVFYTTPEHQNTIRETVVYNPENYPNISYNDYFDTNGKKISTVIYQDGIPYNGTAYDIDQTSVYKDGIVTQRTTYYPGTSIVFEKMRDNKSTFYNFKNKPIGQMQYHVGYYGELVPYQGEIFTRYDNAFYDLHKYDKGEVVYSANFLYNTDPNQEPQISKETFFNPYSQGMSKEIYYYDNGNKREEISYKEGSYYPEPGLSIYYNKDKKNQVIAKFDHLANHGTLLEFNSNNIIISESNYTQGEITHKKTYARSSQAYFDQEESQDDYYLSSEIDYSKKAIYYDKDNQVISEVIYKDQMPFQGTEIVADSYSTTYTPYQNGQKHGQQSTYYSFDLQNPFSVVLYQNDLIIKDQVYSDSVLTQETNYKDGVKHGLFVQFDYSGNKTSELEYINGKPYSGYLHNDFYSVYTIAKYSNGVIQEKEFYNSDNNQLVSIQRYDSQNIYHKEIFDQDNKLIFQYSVKDDYLNGDYKYYENGKVKQAAKFKNGQLEQGQVWVVDISKLDTYSYYESEQDQDVYYILNKNKSTLKLQVVNQEDQQVVMDMQVKIKKDNNQLNPLLARLYSPKDLYPSNDLNQDYYQDSVLNIDHELEQAADFASAATATATSL
ncbi:toxin-antitoxin system YwqK family antitoxin [Myroides sp. LJL119]